MARGAPDGGNAPAPPTSSEKGRTSSGFFSDATSDSTRGSRTSPRNQMVMWRLEAGIHRTVALGAERSTRSRTRFTAAAALFLKASGSSMPMKSRMGVSTETISSPS